MQAPCSQYTDVEVFAGKTKPSSQDDRVQYSAIVQQKMEMQSENASFAPSGEPTPPLPLPDTRM